VDVEANRRGAAGMRCAGGHDNTLRDTAEYCRFWFASSMPVVDRADHRRSVSVIELVTKPLRIASILIVGRV
jgi:hypothetical protein